MKDVDTLSVYLSFKNTGSATWSNSSNKILLRTANPDWNKSQFAHSTLINNSTVATMTESSVAPESIETFTFTLQKPQYSLGTKNEYFQLALEDGTKFNNFFGFVIETSNYAYVLTSQSVSTDLSKLSLGKVVDITYTLQNTGETSWFRDGPKPFRIGTREPTDRPSLFANANWISPSRPAGLPTERVHTGETVNITFPVQTNTAGNFTEKFLPLLEDFMWLDGTVLTANININLNYNWQIINQSSTKDLNDLQLEERSTLTFTVKNTG